jgi:hypothetical protein
LIVLENLKIEFLLQMIALVAGVFDESRSRLLNVTNVSQLLLIVSDGRGIFREGVEVVKQSVRRLVNMGVFTVFVILDNPSESHKQVGSLVRWFVLFCFALLKGFPKDFQFSCDTLSITFYCTSFLGLRPGYSSPLLRRPRAGRSYG